jgi:hypothetical protein
MRLSAALQPARSPGGDCDQDRLQRGVRLRDLLPARARGRTAAHGRRARRHSSDGRDGDRPRQRQ